MQVLLQLAECLRKSFSIAEFIIYKKKKKNELCVFLEIHLVFEPKLYKMKICHGCECLP